MDPRWWWLVNGDTWNLSIDYRPKIVEVGQEVEIYGELTRNGSTVPDVDVSLFINDMEMKTKKTDENGRYSFVVTFNEPGEYSVYTMAYPEGKPVISKKLLTGIGIAAGTLAVVGAAAYKPKKKKKR